MTSSESAAWVSAGAAVLQAIGAVAAIFVTAHLARSSERRAAAAEQAADKRVRAAETAADRRTVRAAADANNAAVIEAVGQADAALAIFEDCRQAWATETRNSYFAGFELPPNYSDIEQAMASSRLQDLASLDVKSAVRELMRVLNWRERERQQSGKPAPASEIAAMFDDWIGEVSSLRGRIAAGIIEAAKDER